MVTPADNWIAGYNTPGYLPEAEPATFRTWEDAKLWMLQELDFQAAVFDAGADDDSDALSGVAQDLNLVDGPEWQATVNGMAYWITRS